MCALPKRVWQSTAQQQQEWWPQPNDLENTQFCESIHQFFTVTPATTRPSPKAG